MCECGTPPLRRTRAAPRSARRGPGRAAPSQRLPERIEARARDHLRVSATPGRGPARATAWAPSARREAAHHAGDRAEREPPRGSAGTSRASAETPPTRRAPGPGPRRRPRGRREASARRAAEDDERPPARRPRAPGRAASLGDGVGATRACPTQAAAVAAASTASSGCATKRASRRATRRPRRAAASCRSGDQGREPERGQPRAEAEDETAWTARLSEGRARRRGRGAARARRAARARDGRARWRRGRRAARGDRAARSTEERQREERQQTPAEPRGHQAPAEPFLDAAARLRGDRHGHERTGKGEPPAAERPREEDVGAQAGQEEHAPEERLVRRLGRESARGPRWSSAPR